MSAEAGGRRLAAILAADVVGYSRLIGADEPGTLAKLAALRSTVIDPQMAAYGGRVFKTTGDGLLAEFASGVQAVQCAIAIQKAMRERQGIELRIGLHSADVTVQPDGDLLGDGVNVAARLEALAEPGGICISSRVREDATGKIALDVEDVGTPELKNIAQRHRVFRLRLDAPERPTLALPDKPSIAVLPFANMSGDPEQEYFADGMVEEIITGLSRVRSFFVIARNSSFAYKGKAPDVRQVGRELGVRYVLEGSVRKAGNRVRITGELVDATSGAHIWADRFDGTLEDIFDLQDRVTVSVVAAIEPRIRMAEVERAQRKPTEDLQAYDLVLRALPHMHSLSQEHLQEAERLLRRATEIDPKYGLACAHLVECLYLSVMQGWTPATESGFNEMARLARAALDHADADPEVIAWAAVFVATPGGDLDGAIALVEKALTLNQNSTDALLASGYLQPHAGNTETAVSHLERAARLNPLGDSFYRYHITAQAYFWAGQYERAAEFAQKALHERPNLTLAMRYLAASLALLGRIEEARDAVRRIRAVVPEVTVSRLRTFLELETPRGSKLWDKLDTYFDGLRRAGLPE